jgi:Fur family peroxide stress response transcriptional regulator
MGLKLTPQRLAILNYLEGNTRHPSAEDIYKELKGAFPSLSLATVYNTLDVLAKAGELQEVRIMPDKRNFDPNPKPHSHFLCRKCSTVHDLDAGLVNTQLPPEAKGYILEGYSLNYFGICPACQADYLEK